MSLTVLGLILSVPLLSPSHASGDLSLLKKCIISHNLDILNKSLDNGSYRGEQGILRIRPETGKSFGMKTLINKDYLDARALFKKAARSLQIARRAMASQKKVKSPGEHVKKIAASFLLYKRTLESGRKIMKTYHSRLNPSIDDRLNDAINIRLMDKLLKECLIKTKNRLRDALGCFYNLCQGVNKNESSLTPQNVHFVNSVFKRFIQQASQEDMNMFDLDRDNGHRKINLTGKWKNVVEKRGLKCIPLLEAALKENVDKTYAVDPLLFIALMRRESNFNPLAISPVGAAGLTQIIPATAKALGMKTIFTPHYFFKAVSLYEREKSTRREAKAALFRINEKNQSYYADQARTLMQTSLILGAKREKLFARYKHELSKNHADDRLQPALSIKYGLKYFAEIMKAHKGDISLALASYNAGPHRVIEFEGIPPYSETIFFRKKVLEYYRAYQRKAGDASL